MSVYLLILLKKNVFYLKNFGLLFLVGSKGKKIYKSELITLSKS